MFWHSEKSGGCLLWSVYACLCMCVWLVRLWKSSMTTFFLVSSFFLSSFLSIYLSSSLSLSLSLSLSFFQAKHLVATTHTVGVISFPLEHHFDQSPPVDIMIKHVWYNIIALSDFHFSQLNLNVSWNFILTERIPPLRLAWISHVENALPNISTRGQAQSGHFGGWGAGWEGDLWVNQMTANCSVKLNWRRSKSVVLQLSG